MKTDRQTDRQKQRQADRLLKKKKDSDTDLPFAKLSVCSSCDSFVDQELAYCVGNL